MLVGQESLDLQERLCRDRAQGDIRDVGDKGDTLAVTFVTYVTLSLCNASRGGAAPAGNPLYALNMPGSRLCLCNNL